MLLRGEVEAFERSFNSVPVRWQLKNLSEGQKYETRLYWRWQQHMYPKKRTYCLSCAVWYVERFPAEHPARIAEQKRRALRLISKREHIR